VAGCSVSGDCRSHPASFQCRNELIERVCRQRIASNQNHRILIDQHNPGQVFFSAKRKLLVERYVRGDLKIVQQ
jgi:hypothetical protein